MKILTLSNCDLVPSQGSGYVIMGFAAGMKERGHSVTLVGPDGCIVAPQFRKARSLRLALGMWMKSKRLVRELQPDLVEFWGGESWLATDRLSKMRGRSFPIVARSNGIEPFAAETLTRHGIHNTAHGEPPKWYQGRLRVPTDRAFRKADAIVTVSQPEANYALRMAYQKPDRVLGIDNALPAAYLGKEFVPARPQTVGYCGSWVARKGVGLLVTDMTAVLREFPDWRFHLVGVGERFRAAEHFPVDVQPRVQVTPFVTDKGDLRRIYGNWAIAVVPSIYESFGLVAAEAMACGCALVASRTGFAESLADGTEAMLLAGSTSPSLASAVARLIADKPLRDSVARAGWARAQTLRWENSVSALEGFYTMLLPRFRQPMSTAQ